MLRVLTTEPTWLTESHNFVANGCWKTGLGKGRKPVPSKARIIASLGRESKDFNDAFHCISRASLSSVLSPLESINVCQFGGDDGRLIHNHAKSKHSKENSLDKQSQNVQELGWFVQAGDVMCADSAVTAHTGIKANCDQEERVHTGKTGVKDKEKKVLVIPNTDTIVDPGTVI